MWKRRAVLRVQENQGLAQGVLFCKPKARTEKAHLLVSDSYWEFSLQFKCDFFQSHTWLSGEFKGAENRKAFGLGDSRCFVGLWLGGNGVGNWAQRTCFPVVSV